jgi:hypothetical protein
MFKSFDVGVIKVSLKEQEDEPSMQDQRGL